MSGTANLLATRCALCHSDDDGVEIYPSTLRDHAFTETVFSARRLPDRVHYRMVRCRTCGLVRSNPVASPERLDELYAGSSFHYGDEVPGIRRTYGRYLRRLEKYGVRKGRLLEIGCGNGFFLQEALAQGFSDVRGVEPSGEAIALADPAIRDRIVHGVMRPGLFETEQFDVICMLQVFDHLANPGEVLDTCHKVLRPGGLMLCVNHNVEAASARLLGERSPIVDVEHTYLYSPSTMRDLLEQHHFAVQEVVPVLNSYSVRYLIRLVPLPMHLKRKVLSLVDRTFVAGISLRVPLGNLSLVASKV